MTAPATPTSHLFGPPSGFMKVGGEPGSRTGGTLVVVAFDNVASVANGQAVTDIQAYAYVHGAHRVKRCVFAASAVATATGKADVYDQAGTPASILSAQPTLAAAATAYNADPASTDAHVGPACYTLRAVTTATSAAFTNFKAYLEIELLS
jgi:hypothetical protein